MIFFPKYKRRDTKQLMPPFQNPFKLTGPPKGSKVSLQNFKSQFAGGFASPARYMVKTIDGQGNSREWLAEAVTTPSRSFVSYNDTIYGTVKQFPYRTQYSDEIVMTIPLSESNSERSYFEAWQNALVNQSHQSQQLGVQHYNSNLEVITLDRNDKQTSVYSIFGAWPSSIIPTNYGYGMQNETAKVQVTFTYHKYEYETK